MRIDVMKRAVVSALEDIKGQDIKTLDVRKMTALFDFMILCSADSTRQTKALASHAQNKLREKGAVVYGVEGEQTGEWILVDLGRILVHIMQPAIRAHFGLEHLWGNAKEVKRRDTRV